MRKWSLIGLATVLLLGGGAAAHAARGYATAGVNMRTGPDTNFPVVEVIPEGAPVEVAGCLTDESWCDVIWGPNRGWVYSEYLGFEDRGDYLPLPDIGLRALGIPVTTFAVRTYWNRHYLTRPWYRERSRWFAFNVRPREGWYAPPPGRRVPGWWRQRYAPLPGMRPPVDRWRIERRDDRRDWREDRREWRQERREDRREWRQERREDRRDWRQERRDWR